MHTKLVWASSRFPTSCPKQLEKEKVEWEQQAARLAEEIMELSGEARDRIG